MVLRQGVVCNAVYVPWGKEFIECGYWQADWLVCDVLRGYRNDVVTF